MTSAMNHGSVSSGRFVSRPNGFTLIELIIVIILIAVVAGLAMNSFFVAMEQSYERDAILRMRTLQSALEVKRRLLGDYPATDMVGLNAINTGLGLQTPENDFYTNYRYTYFPFPANPHGEFTLEITTRRGWAVAYTSSGSRFYCSTGPCPTCDITLCP